MIWNLLCAMLIFKIQTGLKLGLWEVETGIFPEISVITNKNWFFFAEGDNQFYSEGKQKTFSSR